MAAVSTNYGTAGDSTLESSASRSRGTKGSSKDGSGSGSGSGSNSASATRSRSHSRVQRKRAGTASRFMPHLGVDANLRMDGPGLGSGSGSGSGSPSGSGIPSSSKDVLCRDENTHAHAHGSSRKKRPVMSGGCPKPDSATDTPRAPMRRSMFPLNAPLKQSVPKLEKGKKHSMRSGEGNVFPTDSDLIELVPRPHARHESCGDDRGDGEDPDRMVIHKEVRYSIQYEDGEDVEARQYAQEVLRKNCIDVSACV